MSIELIKKLNKEKELAHGEWVAVFKMLREQRNRETDATAFLRNTAHDIAVGQFGNKVFTRGLIEFTNYCKNNCCYCGIRRGNGKLNRYRLTEEEILGCCHRGHELGFRTFVLQGGEDPGYSTDRVSRIIESIKKHHPDCAVTLSFGEHSREVYREWKEAGADRYLLRHETADDDHYRMLHPGDMSPERRKQCLRELKELGYQVGTGFMVGSPGQTEDTLAQDMIFIRELEPHMVGIGPFVPHRSTPFAKEPPGTAELTVDCISLLRIMLPKALIPATTALGTIDASGREKGILAGANVVMPNLSPKRVRKQYEIYDNKLSTGEEAAESRQKLKVRMETIGYELAAGRGDHPDIT